MRQISVRAAHGEFHKPALVGVEVEAFVEQGFVQAPAVRFDDVGDEALSADFGAVLVARRAGCEKVFELDLAAGRST